MPILATSGITMPRTVADEMIRKAQDGSAVARLSSQRPFRFGETDMVTINGAPKAEFVGEGANKASTSASFGVVTAKPRKAQVTLRFNEEVQWADEDHQLGILSELADLGADAISRALDIGTLHGINPSTGTALSGSPATAAGTALGITAGSDPTDDLEAAAGLLVAGGVMPTGAALDPALAYALATQRNAAGQRIHPELGLDPSQISAVAGLSTAVGDTVSCPEATVPTKVRGLVGDWSNGIRWGVARTLPVELIRHGDPDGDGDLKRKNQIALRLETVFVWYVDPTKFASIKDA